MAVRNPAVGYCQGLNFVVALLLLVTRDEEATFWLGCVFMEDFVPPNFHDEVHPPVSL
jgi:hypothetical protein